MFLVLEQISFIGYPLFSQFIKICKIKMSIQGKRFIIIYFPFSVKLIIFPFPFIGYLSIGIKESSKTIHLIFRPLSVINTSLLEYHHAMTTFFPIFYFTLIRSFTCEIFKGFETRSTSALVIILTYLFYRRKNMLCFGFHRSLRTCLGGLFN